MKARLRLHIGPDAVQVSAGPGDPPLWTEAIAYHTPDELRDAVIRAEAVSREHRRSRKVRVSIDGVLVQRRVLTDLPPVPQMALRALVARGSARFFRQNGHPLVSGAVWSVTAGTERVANAAAIDSVLAQSIVDGAEQSGLLIEDIVPDGGPTDLSLLPDSERRRRTVVEWRRISRLCAGTGVLWLIVLTGLGARLWIESRRVEAELRRLAEPRVALIRARQAMENATVMVEAIQQATDQRASVARWLGLMSSALPDSAYVEEGVVELNGSGMLKGRSDRPRQFLKELESIDRIGPVDLQVSAAIEPNGWEGFAVTIGSRRIP